MGAGYAFWIFCARLCMGRYIYWWMVDWKQMLIFLAGVSFSSQVLCQLGSFCLCSLSTMIRYLGTTHTTQQVQKNVPGRQAFRMAPSLRKNDTLHKRLAKEKWSVMAARCLEFSRMEVMISSVIFSPGSRRTSEKHFLQTQLAQCAHPSCIHWPILLCNPSRWQLHWTVGNKRRYRFPHKCPND